MNTAWHEAAHATACVWLGRPVELVSVTPGIGFPGEEVGRCRAPVSGEIQARDVCAALIGYLSEGAPNWPPAYEDALTERREALGLLLDILKVTEELYEALIGVTRDLLEDPDFRRLQSAIARALAAAPTITGDDVEALATAHGYPTHHKEREHAAQTG